MEVAVHSTLEALSNDERSLLVAAADEHYYAGLDWWENLVATALDPGDRLQIYTVGTSTRPRLVLVTRARLVGVGWRSMRSLASLTNFYSCQFSPALGADAGDPEPIFDALVRSIRSQSGSPQVLRFDSLDPHAVGFVGLRAAFDRAGFATQPFFHFGNWYETFAPGEGFEAYWQARPSKLRNTVKRKGKKLDRDTDAVFDLHTDPKTVAEGIEAYRTIYASSWKDPEPYPDFTEGLIHTAAASGNLRLGVLSVDGVPAAAQLWLLCRGRATIFKLAYDETFRQMSTGSILSAHMLRHVVDVDYGRGDDPYKAEWLPRRRERWGFLAFDPRSPKGLLGAIRHVGAYRFKRALGKLPASATADG